MIKEHISSKIEVAEEERFSVQIFVYPVPTDLDEYSSYGSTVEIKSPEEIDRKEEDI